MSVGEAALRKAFAEMSARVARLEAFTGLYVDERELDNPRRGLRINFDPRDWRGESCKGKRPEECSPAFLDAYAGALQFMGENPKEGTDPKKARYNLLDAARARTWARRLRREAAQPPAKPAYPQPREEQATGPSIAHTSEGSAGLFEDEDDDEQEFDDDSGDADLFHDDAR